MISIKAFYNRLPSLLQWILWVAIVFFLHILSQEIFSLRDLHWAVLVALGTAIFIFLERPLVLWGFPEAFESSVVAILSIIFIFFVGWTYIAPRLAQEELYSQACAPNSLEMKCYLFSRENCQAVWKKYSDDCTTEVRSNMAPDRVTALIGPTVKHCTFKKFDASFSSTRRMSAPSECTAHFQKMDAPSL